MAGPASPFFAQPLPERARWRILLLILCWPVIEALLIAMHGRFLGLPGNNRELLLFLFAELKSWGPVFALSFYLSGITASQLRLRTSHPVSTIALGIFWSFPMKIATGLLVLVASRWVEPTAFWNSQEKLAFLHDARNTTHHLPFSIMAFGLIALIAGFTEELWRAGMLAGMKVLFPELHVFSSILLVSVLFGLSHLYQGWLGVGSALLLGILLGSVMVYRNSYWEAAIAHALLDAFAFGTSIVMMLNVHAYDPQIVYGAARGDLPRVKHWVQMGGDVNATYNANKDWKNITALECAAGHSNPEVVRFLLENGANPNLADSYGDTPLIAATEQNQMQNIRLLIDHGATVNWQDSGGFTALRCAAEYNRVEAARILIDNGADPNIKDKKMGNSSFEAATKYGYTEMLNLLQEKGAKMEAR